MFKTTQYSSQTFVSIESMLDHFHIHLAWRLFLQSPNLSGSNDACRCTTNFIFCSDQNITSFDTTKNLMTIF